MKFAKTARHIGMALALLAPLAFSPALAVEFGNNKSTWANDGECDDPRFEGNGMSGVLLEEDLGRDANDCRALFESGQISLIAAPEKGSIIAAPGVDFGTNASEWADDGECDDPRFRGPGSADELVEADRMRDANDCSSLFAQGQITLISTRLGKNFDYGNNSSDWSNDGECDDPRFQGARMATTLLEEDLGRDADDCRTLFQSGEITLAPGGGASRVSFGDNSSEWSNDGECDDPRFEGTGMAATLLDEDIGRDANDCSTLYFNEQISIR